MAYPDDIDTYRAIANLPGLVYDAADTKTFFTEDLQAVRNSSIAIETELGINPSGIYTTVKNWLIALTDGLAGKQDSLGFTAENVANKDIDVALGVSDTKYPSQKAVKNYVDTAVANAVDAAKIAMRIPVGGIHISDNSTNPAVTLGYGTWVADSVGYGIVGYKSDDSDFGTDGATGGAKTHVLTIGELAVHDHTTDTTFSFTPTDGTSVGDPAAIRVGASANRTAAQAQGGGAVSGGAGSGTAHNNLGPFKVFRVWRRTV